ncbi:hypothetical protein BX616_000813 [Lobosporangium transversale]|uniref:Uncharacterized protein n=1 Tax=Lobosporangium transversale TaxID=64571 RepID=A0A1Y2GFK4_9FUNG|nr:hypothetical protein BCR41DRAFT_424202 [Lobosporangium transversale]KAF9906116.1 hypothetical protein BX616_000813 [Lobosporangium transversale]ORZ09419.1 hypothetical protein BCR41DRAFT_424202 [Lobosporangium transversale]|eukprot:XP_021878872.1 hypothetical protein BCR41DRAFT_424202 [Lobosporangium transversale]
MWSVGSYPSHTEKKSFLLTEQCTIIMSKATIERRVITILLDFQRARKVWSDLVSDGLSQANALVNVQLQQGYVDGLGYWPPALDQFLDLKERFESKLQKRAEAMAQDLETTLTKMNAQYAKMKLQTSQFEYLMEEATEMFGEAFTYRDPIGTTCTLEQIWIQLERVFGLYTMQMIMNQDILDQLIASSLHSQPIFISSATTGTKTATIAKTEATEASLSSDSSSEEASITGSNTAIAPKTGGNTENPGDSCIGSEFGGMLAPSVRRDKDQGMVLLSAWLNQPHLKTDVLTTFDEFCQVELLNE